VCWLVLWSEKLDCLTGWYDWMNDWFVELLLTVLWLVILDSVWIKNSYLVCWIIDWKIDNLMDWVISEPEHYNILWILFEVHGNKFDSEVSIAGPIISNWMVLWVVWIVWWSE
jgi:hypothetical protein